jgi:hypothetical protein
MGQVHSGGGGGEHFESLLLDISFEAGGSDRMRLRKSWYEVEDHDAGILVLEGTVLPCETLSLTENGYCDAFGLGPHSRFDLDEDVQDVVILQGLRDRTYIIIPVVLSSRKAHIAPYCSARMLLLRKSGKSFERVGLFILGSSLISFKLINLINEGRTLRETATIRVI